MERDHWLVGKADIIKDYSNSNYYDYKKQVKTYLWMIKKNGHAKYLMRVHLKGNFIISAVYKILI